MNMKFGGQGKTTSDPSVKDKSNKDADKTAQGTSVRSKAARGLSCRKSGTSVRKASKQRYKTTDSNLVAVEMEQCMGKKSLMSSPKQMTLQESGNDNGYWLHLPPTPSLHPQSPVMTSISTENTPLEVPTPVRGQSPLQIQKFQLQLFPMDEPTRKCLEEESHCPYLELTITTKKKIASVIRHLNIKWGNSRSALEELVLFPYNARVESLESCKRWTMKDSDITAAEVHAAIGKPAVFRLRYGWLNNLEPKICNLSNQLTSKEIQKKDVDDQEKQPSSGVSQECRPLPAELLLKQDVLETAPMKTIQPVDNLRPDNDAKFSWVDCVSNMSFGALFSDLEAAEGAKLCHQVPQKQIPISCDSFDAAIAAHIARYQPRNQSTAMAQPSILDAEETCNPFSFRNFASLNKSTLVQSGITPITSTIQNVEHHRVKLCNMSSPPVEPAHDDGCVAPNKILKFEDDAQPIREEDAQLVVDWQGNKQDEEEMQVNTNAKNNLDNQFEGLDMHWPPSVGPWQFAVSSSQQMISSDSNGLNGLASTSLDIF